ncbi:unnamed protein product, partial [Mesorhabditis spiculigera]
MAAEPGEVECRLCGTVLTIKPKVDQLVCTSFKNYERTVADSENAKLSGGDAEVDHEPIEIEGLPVNAIGDDYPLRFTEHADIKWADWKDSDIFLVFFLGRRMVERPVAAPRRKPQGNNPSALITVFRALTTSQSPEQREVQTNVLARDCKEVQDRIDLLVKNHHHDVEESLVAFRDVSTKISSCRERIYNVRNALSNCRNLFQSRRDDLKRLWEEDKQQRHINDILQKLEELREVKHRVDVMIEQNQYFDAARTIANSRDLIETKFASVSGLSQLRAQLADSSEALAKKIEVQLAEMVVQEPFEQQMVDVVRGMPEGWIGESELTLRLYRKLNQQRHTNNTALQNRIQEHLAALSVLDGAQLVVDRLLALSATQISKQVESATGTQLCQLRRFIHSFVIEEFVERVTRTLEGRLAEALKLDDARTVASNESPILPSAEQVRDMCNEIHEFIMQMDNYAPRFAAVWLLVLSEYTRHINELYEKTTAPVWLSSEARKLIDSLPSNVRKAIREHPVHVTYRDGKVSQDEPVLKGLDASISQLQSVSATCLLMLHLELLLSRYIFDGLGHLCAAIFIHSSQHMQRLTEIGRKRVTRNIWGVQQRLAQLTARREAELDRARTFFELLSHEPDELLCVLADRRSSTEL